MAMDPVIFIDPGLGIMWEPQGNGKTITHTDPNADNKITHDDFARGKEDYNPYCGVAFFANSSCPVFCIDDAVLKALSKFSDSKSTTKRQIKVKLSFYYANENVPKNFYVGFAMDKTATEPDFFYVRTIGETKYRTKVPTGAELTEGTASDTSSPNFAGGFFHNISLMICSDSDGLTFGAAFDDNYLKYVKTDGIEPNTQLHFGIWFPNNSFYVSNVIVCYKDGSGDIDKEIIPPATHLAALDLSDPAEDEGTTFTPDTNKEGEWVGKAHNDKLLQTIDVYNLTQSLVTEGDPNVSVPANPTDDEKENFRKGFAPDIDLGTVVLYGVPAYKSTYFSRNVKGLYGSASKKGFGEISMKDTDTYCIDLSVHDKTLEDIHQQKIGWEISNF